MNAFAKAPRRFSCAAVLIPLVICSSITIEGTLAQGTGFDRQSYASSDRSMESASEAPPPSHRIHTSVIAGSWYPGNREDLIRMLGGFTSRAVIPEASYEHTIALIVPHAGYVYSGATAGCAYRSLGKRHPRRIILIGPSHHAYFEGVACGDYDSFRTPLGDVPVDAEALSVLLKNPMFVIHREAHRREHSLEIQLPFIQQAYTEEPPRIVPLLIGHIDDEAYPRITESIRSIVDAHTMVVVSSDFTHYGPQYQYTPFPCDERIAARLKQLDQGAIEYIERLDRKGFLAYQSKTGATICGYRPIAVLLDLVPRDTEVKLLAYTTSGESTGSYANSVSYVAMAFLRPGLWNATPHAHSKGEETDVKKNTKSPLPVNTGDLLTHEEKETLLALARTTIESYVKGQKIPDPLAGAYGITERLRKKRGAFVTLEKQGTLRGCIGYILPIAPLYESVQKNAVNAAAHDTRFPPVTIEELPQLHIEISVLSEPRKIASCRDIVLGTHGIILKKGYHQAVFLPQVAPEQGWDLNETLRHLSLKAGLGPDAWNEKDTTFEVFTAQVFEEKER